MNVLFRRMRLRMLAVAFVAGCVAAPPTLSVLRLSAQTPAPVDFARDVQPLLRANCYGCHGPSLQNGNLRLDRRRDVMPNRVGANNARVVPGNSAASRLYARITGSSAGLQMPPSGPLPAEQIAILRAWIDQGAEWPDELAGDLPSAPQDARAVRMMDALRTARRTEFERLLRAFPDASRSRGAGGSTPLMFAALYGDVRAVRLLLDSGADANARNDAGATALLWAVDDVGKTRLLLSRGANPNSRSEDGETPLTLAAGRFGAVEVVRALLDGGATLKGQPAFGRAAAAGDEAVMRLLLERGGERTATLRDVSSAIRSECSSCVEMLIESANPAQLNRALGVAAEMGDAARVRVLLERGAVAGSEALRQAAASENVPVEAVKLLLDRGVRDDAALGFALRQGDTAVVATLRAAGATEPAPAVADPQRSAVPPSPREAVRRSLPLLQHADVVFLKAAGCVSCHNNSLFQMTAAMARPRGLRIDEQRDASQRKAIAGYLESWRERVLQDIPIPGAVDTISFTLAGLAAAQFPSDAATDALARYLVRRQGRDGAWRVITTRPPIESSDVVVTALAVRALQAYAPTPQASAYGQSVRRAAAWLRHVESHSTQDRAFKVLGLLWAREDRRVVRAAAQGLIALQRSDGGWSQIATLESDAYATGQALTALAESGTVAVNDSVYQRGTKFLLRTQLEDGSWHVRSRAIPIQPYFDSQFPHGRDQFISAAATNWATMALLPAVR